MSYLPGSASLLQDIDKRMMVVLRDGRTLLGILRSVDQFANLLLHRTIERIYVGNKYGDIPRGIFLVRGDNTFLIGEIDEEKEANLPLEKVSFEEILQAQTVETEKKLEKERIRTKFFRERGLTYVPDAAQEEMI
ncbi:unnamed protein product [Notodromas monacha]|uniref:U6 snRNA-associated Sm-like protein LSm1 n=1 Tax=Notodromas monacha TaxID=399045 RepID=A0A7R9BGT8_9CRUS|nr:unnamed protein product [Notodromas monacha]CAG0915195.1 unnamed protein product [Notodromas monacha]